MLVHSSSTAVLFSCKKNILLLYLMGEDMIQRVSLYIPGVDKLENVALSWTFFVDGHFVILCCGSNQYYSIRLRLIAVMAVGIAFRHMAYYLYCR